MVALAIAGLLFIGVGAALQEQSRTAAHLQQKVAAAQVVRNRIAETMMQVDKIAEGVSTGSAEMGGWKLSWEQQISIYTVEDEMGDLQQRALKLEVLVGEEGAVIESGELYLPLPMDETADDG